MTPFDDVNRMFERMSRMSRGFDDAWGDDWGGSAGRGGFDVDLAEYDDELVVVADLPGYEKSEIDVTVQEGRLTITARRSAERDEGSEEGAYLRRERRSQSARRTVSLPAEVREDDASATYSNGVLTITLPKVRVDDGDDDGHHIDVN